MRVVAGERVAAHAVERHDVALADLGEREVLGEQVGALVDVAGEGDLLVGGESAAVVWITGTVSL